ncbi:hypothetical protein V8F20_004249 [Naviculisporaceae sp. PSN 640]
MSSLNRKDDDYKLNNVMSTKYIPQRQPNPYLKKYHAGRRPLPWKSSKLSSRVTGHEWELDIYENWRWEEAKKTKVKTQRLQERQRRYLDNVPYTDNQDASEQTRKRVKLAPRSSTTADLETQIVAARNKPNRPKDRQRPRDPHLVSAIKATSKRQGHRSYYTPCSCCYMSSRIHKSRDFKRSLAMLVVEHSSSSPSRPGNPQSGRVRFHEGRDRVWERKRQSQAPPVFCWAKTEWGFWPRFHNGQGGRGLRGWMREDRRKRVVPLGDPVEDDDVEVFMGDIGLVTRQGQAEPYRVRYIVARRSCRVEDQNSLTLDPVDVVDYPLYWGRDMGDMAIDSASELDAWVQDEWVCLSVDGSSGDSEDGMALSWIEVDDASEDDIF